MIRMGKTYRTRRMGDYVRPIRILPTSLPYVVFLTLFGSSLLAQGPPPFDQQLRDNQRRLEDIRRERSEVEQELERLRTQAHSLTDELYNIERQKETTNRIVNELDRQINGLTSQIDRITVDLLLAEDALVEKQAVLERRLVDIYKRGPLYAYQVLFAAESFGDLLSRYKYLYLVSRQDRLLANDMTKLRNRIPREHRSLLEAPAGTAVRAVAAGSVSLAGPLGTYLTSVLLNHGGGYYTFYGYLGDAVVTKGERVARGQVIGHVGGAASDQGPHLHFEIRGQGGIALDPVNWLRGKR